MSGKKRIPKPGTIRCGASAPGGSMPGSDGTPRCRSWVKWPETQCYRHRPPAGEKGQAR